MILALRDHCPPGDFHIAPPVMSNGTMHVEPGLRWCIAVADSEEDLALAASYLFQVTQSGWSNDMLAGVKALFDRFRSRWNAGDFECQRRQDGFDFRDILRPL